MRKKLHTRFPATRIKKIMQSDEDIGKIALAVPVLVSKALELFLQDLCDKTYNITLRRGVKTMGSFHLKQCVHKFTVFDFLKDLVREVPDVGGYDADPNGKAGKKRKAADEDNYSEEEIKRSNNEACRSSSRRGQGRCRGKGRGSLVVDGVDKGSADFNIYEDDPGTPQHDDERTHSETTDGDIATASEENCVTSGSARATVRNFDLNMDFNDIEEIAPASATATIFKVNHDLTNDHLGSSISNMDKITIDPLQFALSHRRLDEEEEDYDIVEG